jgi:3-oxoadipate enol-lactonase
VTSRQSLLAVTLVASLVGLSQVSITTAQSVRGQTPAGLAYEASGAGEALVFIHGFSLDRHMWQPQVEAFGGHHRVIRYDLRGHGDSAAASEPYTGHEDLLGLLDALRVDRATLVGLSAGSELAINFALTYPDRVARLVLASPGLGGYRGSPLPWMQPVLDAAMAGDAERAARQWTKTPLMQLVSGVERAPLVAGIVMRNARLWTSKRTELPLSPPAVGRLAAITCPVLVVLGENDQPHIREIARAIADGIPAAALTVIPRAGHLVNLDSPDAFNGVVGAFLDTHRPRAARTSARARRLFSSVSRSVPWIAPACCSSVKIATDSA